VTGAPLLTQSTNDIPAVRVVKPPTIDGVVTDEEWKGLASASGGFDEENGAPAPEESQYWFGYDDKYIYFAARLKDRNPKAIKATQFRPNVSLSGDDFVGFYVDPFGTLNDTNNFEMNPQGATNLRINGGRAAKVEWLGEMVSRARITADGWETEARVPWSVMRLPEAGKRDLRINAYRILSRTQRSYIMRDISAGKLQNTPYWRGVEVPKRDDAKRLMLLPYVYGGLSEREGLIANSGVDLKYPLTDSLDLIGSINPDFRNIENQVLSLDFSYFERLAGETRPFFLEGSGYFRTSGDAPLFVSQRIRQFDVGVKTYGKISDQTQFAFLNTTDFQAIGGNFGFPESGRGTINSLVGDVRHSFGPRTNLNMAVANLSMPGVQNTGTFIGGGHGFGPFDAFFQYMTTQDQAPERDTGRMLQRYGTRFNTGLSWRNAGAYVGGEFVDISPDFLPRLGFAPQRGFRGFEVSAGYEKTLPRGGIMEYGFDAGASDLRLYGGGVFRRGVGLGASVTLRDGTDFDFGAQFEQFREFHDRLFSIDVERPRGDPYRRWSLGYTWGELAGQPYSSFGPRFAYRPTQRLQLNASFQAVRHFEDLTQTIVSANYDINASDSVSGRLVRVGSDTSAYVSFRRAGNRGAEYYVIVGDPNARTFQPSVIIKAVFPMNLKF